MLNVTIEMRRRREAVWILVGGVVVAAAPAFWYARVWPDAVTRYGQNDGPSHGAWWFLFVCSIVPFILVAVLRERGSMSRIATSVAVLAVGVIVVLGQLAGLNPNDPSSTAPIAIVTTPAAAAVLVILIFITDEQIRAARSRRGRADDNR
jgi:peptidoglycan/LPS O-acetylase OafA/YrhL